MMSAMSRSSVATSLSSPASLGPALVVALAGLAGGGCGGTSQTAIVIAPPPPPSTVGVLVGNLCEGQACTCRDPAAPADGGAGVPEGGAKRFEIRLGPTDAELWATVDDMTLYKSREQVSMCYYVDLGPGEHTVGLRASRDAGVQASMEIAEYGPGAQSWYETFRFACGVKGVCSPEDLEAQRAVYAGIARGIHDPCGSVRVSGITWDTGTQPDRQVPQDLVLRLGLKIYKFTPDKVHGDPACNKDAGAGAP